MSVGQPTPLCRTRPVRRKPPACFTNVAPAPKTARATPTIRSAKGCASVVTSWFSATGSVWANSTPPSSIPGGTLLTFSPRAANGGNGAASPTATCPPPIVPAWSRSSSRPSRCSRPAASAILGRPPNSGKTPAYTTSGATHWPRTREMCRGTKRQRSGASQPGMRKSDNRVPDVGLPRTGC